MPSPTQIPRPTAPRDYLQFFLSILDQRHADALSFTDTTGSHQLFIARDREAALHYIQQDSEQTRAHLLDLDGGISDTDLARLADAVPGPARSSETPSLPSHQPSQPHPANPDSDSDTSLAPLDHDNGLHQGPTPTAKKRRLEDYSPPSSPPQDLQYTVTNRNRDRLRRARAKDRAASPSAGDGDAALRLPRAQTPTEAAFRLTLTKHHLPEVTWLMAQTGPPSTVTAALQMITNAKAIGDATVIQSWKALCAHWRTYRTLTTIDLHAHNPASSQTLATPHHLQGADRAVQALYRVFQAVNQSEVDGALQLMFHRRYFADLFQQYGHAEAAVAAEPLGDDRPQGVTNAALVKKRLFLSLYPEYTALATPRTDPRSKKAWDDFHTKLEKGRRWLHLRDETNAGIFALIPESVSNRWIEKELPFDVFRTWVRLIHHCNQPAIALGEAMLPGLQHALSGQSMPARKIRLEITDVGDLKDYSDTSILFQEVDESSAG
jgi:hypothetical protein